MSIFNKTIISLISASALISCGKSSDGNKSSSKSNSNKALLSTWEGDVEISGKKLKMEFDLTKAVVNSRGQVLLTITDTSTLVCSGNIELKGSNSIGNMKFDSMVAKSFRKRNTETI